LFIGFAEQYAELLGAHTHHGRLPSVDLIRSSLAEAWPMVTASFLPVASIGIAVFFGASSSDAAQAALIVTVVLLIMHGYRPDEQPAWVARSGS